MCFWRSGIATVTYSYFLYDIIMNYIYYRRTLLNIIKLSKAPCGKSFFNRSKQHRIIFKKILCNKLLLNKLQLNKLQLTDVQLNKVRLSSAFLNKVLFIKVSFSKNKSI